jgi:hypothetical protein
MIELARNEFALEFLRDENSLLDGKLLELSLSSSEKGLQCILKIRMRKKSLYECLYLHIEGVTELDIFYENEDDFYNIERVKFLNFEGQYYFSLDPVDDSCNRDDKDCFYMLGKEIRLMKESKI